LPCNRYAKFNISGENAESLFVRYGFGDKLLSPIWVLERS
jgi:hypothetical protein